jgi:excisionase family DNA binding protein
MIIPPTKGMVKKKSETLLDTEEVAKRLGVTRRQAQMLIQQGKLPATKIGRDCFIEESDLEIAENRPRPGRPKKKKAGETEDDEEE